MHFSRVLRQNATLFVARDKLDGLASCAPSAYVKVAFDHGDFLHLPDFGRGKRCPQKVDDAKRAYRRTFVGVRVVPDGDCAIRE
jgi:hypothetical protein